MLRSSRDRYAVALCPESLLAVRRRTGLRATVDSKVSESFCAPVSVPSWKPAVEALDRFAQEHGARTGSLSLVLSNHFTRYLLVPWSERVVNAEELLNYVAAAFEDVYGDVSAGWHLRVSPERPGSPRLAAAVDRELVEAVREVVGRSRLRITSIQPHLMAAFNAFGQRRETDFVFVVLEASRLCMIAAQGGVWRHVSGADAPADPVALAMSLEREIELAGLSDETPPAVFVHATQWPALALPALLGKSPQMVPWKSPAGLDPTADAVFAMAALAV